MKPIILSVLRARTTGTPPTKETFKDEAPMLGLMQNRPLLISDLVDYVATWHAETEIVSRDPKGVMHRSNTGRSLRGPNASPMRSPRSASAPATASQPSPGILGGTLKSITA